jgi:hypothetical protein
MFVLSWDDRRRHSRQVVAQTVPIVVVKTVFYANLALKLAKASLTNGDDSTPDFIYGLDHV